MGVFKKALVSTLFLLSFFVPVQLGAWVPQWDWSSVTIDFSTFAFPKYMGTAIAEYQYSGSQNCPDSNWAAWEAKKTHNGHATIAHNHVSGSAADGRNKWRDDIALLKELGVNSFRFSVEWSTIEPAEGQWNKAELDHYLERCIAYKEAGIEPMVTLLHFTYPAWFQERGGFERQENIDYFVRFCTKVFAKLSEHVHLWCTINEIGASAFEGYVHGVHPPGECMNLRKWAHVVRNQLNAHCQVYKALKAMPNGDCADIGPVHAYLTFENSTKLSATALQGILASIGASKLVALQSGAHLGSNGDQIKQALMVGALCATPYALCEYLPAKFMTYLFNGAILNFFRTGTLFPWVPGLRMTIADAPDCYDFFGINCYSRVVMQLQPLKAIAQKCNTGVFGDVVIPTGRSGEVMTDMQFAVCPEALYAALADVSTLRPSGVPIYVTENGIADADDSRRALWIKRYLYAVSQAIQDGYDVRGYYYWSFMDNFEWNEGLYTKRFGLYHVDFDSPDKIRTLRTGATVYCDAIRAAHLR